MYFLFNYMTGDIVSRHKLLARAQAAFKRRQPKSHNSYSPVSIWQGDPKKVEVRHIANCWKLLNAERCENTAQEN